MRTITLLLFFYISGLAVLAQNSNPQSFTIAKNAEEAGFSTVRLQRVDALLDSFVTHGIAPNAVTFVARHGKIVSHKAFGYSNIENKIKIREDDIFRIASQTKAIATVGLMIFLEQGKFQLSDPISKYIPSFKNPRVLESFDVKTGAYETRPAKSEITIRQLLSHTAGIPYNDPLQDLPEFKIPYFNSLKPDVLEDVVKKIASRPLTSDPGEKFEYGLGIDVVGYLIEVLSGQKLDVFLANMVTGPLGMNDTYFYLPEKKSKRLVELYSKESEDGPLTVCNNNDNRLFPVSGAKTYFTAGAGMVGTIEDYAKFCQMLLNFGSFNNHQILGRKTVEMMSRNQIGELEVRDYKDKFGLGLQIITEVSTYGAIITPGSLTWGGMYSTEYIIDPKEDLILLIYTNVDPYANSDDFIRRFETAVYQALK